MMVRRSVGLYGLRDNGEKERKILKGMDGGFLENDRAETTPSALVAGNLLAENGR